MVENDREIVCLRCGWKGAISNLFCPHCGLLLGKAPECYHHPHREARGVCVICLRPFCDECGSRKGGIFLCSIHAVHEIRNETALVYETENADRAHLVREILRQSGLHPRELQEESGVRHQASGGNEPDEMHTEVQIFVPFPEVEKADDVVASITEV